MRAGMAREWVARCRTTRARPSRARAGFTLIEVAVTIGLIAVLMAFVWPAMLHRIHDEQMPQSAENLRATLRLARAASSMSGQRYRIRFVPEQQQPVIEREPDAMNRPGEWEQASDLWGDEPLLLGDVNVIEVRLGRPEYLTPISYSLGDGEGLVDQEFDLDNESQVARDEVEEEFVDFEIDREEEPEDEFRPSIVFDIDGMTDWLIIVIARAKPGEELDEDVEQLWVMLDGRTGLPYVREAMTDDEMMDEEIRPDLDKLQPMDTGLGEMTFVVPGGGAQSADGTAIDPNQMPPADQEGMSGDPSEGSSGRGDQNGQGGQNQGGQGGQGVTVSPGGAGANPGNTQPQGRQSGTRSSRS
jgi:prepilin-type N-terminal cleavage/methylation domain-containing protein